MDVRDLREEFRAGYREGAARGSAAEELRTLGAWLRRLPGGLARFLVAQLRALWTMSVGFLWDALRGTPTLVVIILRGIARGVRAAASRSAGAGAAAPTPTPAAKPEAKEQAPAEGQEQPEEEAQHAEEAPAGPPWKKPRKAPAKAAPAKQEPAPAPAGKSLGDLAELAGIGFLVLVLVVAFGGMLLRVLGNLLAPYASGIVLVLVVVWCVAAAIVAPRDEGPVDEDEEPGEERDEEDPTENDHEKSAGEEDQETDPWPAQREAIRVFVEAEVAAGNAGYRDAKGKGAPVDALLAELQRRGSAQGWDRNAMLDLLDRAGITVRQQMKFRIGGKQKTPPGVHVDDLTNDLGFRPRLPAHLVPDLTPQPGPSREVKSRLG